MGQIQLLIDELNNDPLGVSYSGMSNIEVANSLNDKSLSKNKSSLQTSEILEAIVSSALMSLTGDKAVRVWGLLGMESVDPFGVAASVLIDAFGAQSETISALAILRKESISRAQQLGYPGVVKEGHVEMARAKIGV